MGTLEIYAQGLDDALQFSRQKISGSARFNAMGGAFSALGGDLGAIHINPAATGVFTKNELGLTLGFGHTINDAKYYGENTSGRHGNVNVNNFGVLFSSEINHPDWRTLNVGVTYTRTNDYNRKVKYKGTQSDHSFAEELTYIANSEPFTQNQLLDYFPFDVGPAFQAYVIDTLAGSDVGYYSPLTPGEPITQELNLLESGRGSEFQMSLGANYKDRLYIGAGLKVGAIVISRKLEHTESPENKESLKKYIYGNELDIRGTSYSFSAGIIARINQMFRVGLSAQTPNFYVNNERYSYSFESHLAGDYANYAGSPVVYASSPEGSNRYNFKTPWRLGGGVAAVFGPKAILSVDYEYQNFGASRFNRNRQSGYSYDFDVENNDIETVLGASSNVRAGFEYRILPVSLRAGYAFYQDPVKPEFRNSLDRNIHQFSVGGGIRFKTVYVDAGYFYRATKSQYGLYNTGYNEYADLDISQHSFSVTVGVRY